MLAIHMDSQRLPRRTWRRVNVCYLVPFSVFSAMGSLSLRSSFSGRMLLFCRLFVRKYGQLHMCDARVIYPSSPNWASPSLDVRNSYSQGEDFQSPTPPQMKQSGSRASSNRQIQRLFECENGRDRLVKLQAPTYPPARASSHHNKLARTAKFHLEFCGGVRLDA
ncbi:hypothetical protein B0J11DRAFT_216623 [Dendryphion nanum]|uniref:Uncharacterized protein n=1 Tax=Dendryphion nanum TaxID=256645 RepID=A0A9P9E6R2_9PLEO|nr:hypothetical protein B0J11DRAFT_216623 [Dendryphion nanum]